MIEDRTATEHKFVDPQVTNALEPEDADSKPDLSSAALKIDTMQLFEQATEQTRMAMTISDPFQDDNPIVFVNQAFEAMTGFGRAEAVGRNCRFLQGKETDPKSVEAIRDFLKSETVGIVEILNYRKDGTPFWNMLHIGPIYDEAGKLTHFYGSQWDVTEIVEERRRHAFDQRIARELRHRTNNLFSVFTAILNMSARTADNVPELVERVTGRIGALSKAHQVSLGDEEDMQSSSDLHALIEAVVNPYRNDNAARFEVVGPIYELSAPMVTPLGLAIHELATNALKHGALGADDGTVRVEWEAGEDLLHLYWTEAGGPEIDLGEGETPRKGGGSRLLSSILSGVGGTVDIDWKRAGVKAHITLPTSRSTPS